MKIRALIAVLMFVCASGVWAQGKPLACMEDAKAGLVFENSQWRVHTFEVKRFILMADGYSLNPQSAAKAMATEDLVLTATCSVDPIMKVVTCIDALGTTLYFDPSTNKGGVSKLFGSAMRTKGPHMITASAFTCQPF